MRDWHPHITVAAVVERDGRWLLVEEHTRNGLLINQPAGHLEAGESLTQAVVRETREETGWHFEPGFLVGIYQFAPAPPVTYLRFAFGGALREADEEAELDPAIHRLLWLDDAELAECSTRHRSPAVLRCIRDYRTGKQLPLSCLADLGSLNP